MKFIISVIAVCLILIIGVLMIGESLRCEHEDMVTMVVFASYTDISGTSHTRQVCRECGEAFSYQNFQGELADKSYLSAIKEHSDGIELIPGEYYTVKATVPLGFYGHSSKRVWLTCQVENDEYRVRFSVEFREEFREAVSLVEDKETITFRGRFYDQGCGFTDCELINN